MYLYTYSIPHPTVEESIDFILRPIERASTVWGI